MANSIDTVIGYDCDFDVHFYSITLKQTSLNGITLHWFYNFVYYITFKIGLCLHLFFFVFKRNLRLPLNCSYRFQSKLRIGSRVHGTIIDNVHMYGSQYVQPLFLALWCNGWLQIHVNRKMRTVYLERACQGGADVNKLSRLQNRSVPSLDDHRRGVCWCHILSAGVQM